MAKQFLALVEEGVRGQKPSSGWLFLPVTGALEPTMEYDDQPRQEHRGQDTALGDKTLVRRASSWTYTLECPWYVDCQAIGVLFKHLLGYAGARATVDTTGKKGILYPVANPFGTGPLGNKAIGIIPNTDENDVTKSRYYGGGRVTDCEIVFSGVEDVKLKFTLKGAGDWVQGEAAEIADPVFPSLNPFVSSDALMFLGSGISRTGVAPDFTEISEGTLPAFAPDELTIKIANGLADKTVMNGVKGPSKTVRENKFSVEVSAPCDYEDPASGFSSADQWKNLFSSPKSATMLVKLTHASLAGAATEKYSAALDLPLLAIKADTPSRTSDGKTPKVSFTLTSLSYTYKPIHLLTVDQNASL